MNTDTISQWLRSPSQLPDHAAIEAVLRANPWFAPARLMEAAEEQRQVPFSPRCLSLIQLFGADWLSAYRLISSVGQQAPASLERDSDRMQAVVPGPEIGTKTVEFQRDHPEGSGDTPFIPPLYSEDYFRYKGEIVPDTVEDTVPAKSPEQDDPKTLMVVMSFAEWLSHFKVKSEREQEEERDKRALRSMWQQEKLAAALEDEPEEIPEDVFEMAVSSITREDDLASESLAEILEKQGKWTAAVEMYRKLGLRNPAKSAYFASRAEAAKKRAT